jgi:hypothetical protein
MTENMKNFIEANKTSKVVFGEMLTSKNKPVFSNKDLESSDRNLYRLKNGKEFILTISDKNSTPDFMPEWDHGN